MLQAALQRTVHQKFHGSSRNGTPPTPKPKTLDPRTYTLHPTSYTTNTTSYRGASLIRKRSNPYDPHTALGMILLLVRFFWSKVPLKSLNPQPSVRFANPEPTVVSRWERDEKKILARQVSGM